jgi:TolA-binding protein
MTTGGGDVTHDPVSQTQEELTLDGAQKQDGQFATRADLETFREEMRQQGASMEGRVRGLNTRIDLDRQNVQKEESAVKQESKARQIRSRLDELDETTRLVAESQAETLETSARGIRESISQAQPAEAPQAQAGVSAERRSVLEANLRDMGIDPATPGIDYNMPLITQAEQAAFMKHAIAAHSGSPRQPVAQTPSGQPPSPRPTVVTPPMEGTPTSGTDGDFMTLTDRWNAGQIDRDQFLVEAKRLGYNF